MKEGSRNILKKLKINAVGSMILALVQITTIILIGIVISSPVSASSPGSNNQQSNEYSLTLNLVLVGKRSKGTVTHVAKNVGSPRTCVEKCFVSLVFKSIYIRAPFVKPLGIFKVQYIFLILFWDCWKSVKSMRRTHLFYLLL